jgi:hypothetical protein
MGCFANGFPTGAPEHFRFTAIVTPSFPEPIFINWVATKHVRMEQMVAHWSGVPTTSEPLILQKRSGTSFRIHTILISVDPSIAASGGENLTDLACVIPFYWAKGDSVRIDYPNSDNQDIGVEIMLVEVE